MEKAFLKVTTPEAVEVLESCMHEGYTALDRIMADYERRKADSTNPSSAWADWTREWLVSCIAKLDRIYVAPHRSAEFRHARTTRYGTSGDKPYTGLEHTIEAKMNVLKKYYDFILQKSPITINVNGSINYQVGNDNQNEQ